MINTLAPMSSNIVNIAPTNPNLHFAIDDAGSSGAPINNPGLDFGGRIAGLDPSGAPTHGSTFHVDPVHEGVIGSDASSTPSGPLDSFGPDVGSGGSNPTNVSYDGTNIGQFVPENELAAFYSNNPGATAEDMMRYMAQRSDIWAEKYIDYLVQRDSIDRANQYSANREDTAYQRLVKDLKAAGLNPALMYGSSASISAGGSAGTINVGDNSTKNIVDAYQKIKNVLIALTLMQFNMDNETANTIFRGIGSLSTLFKLLL